MSRLLRLIDKVSRRAGRVEAFDEALQLCRVLRVGHVHRVVCADDALLLRVLRARSARPAILSLRPWRVYLVEHWVGSACCCLARIELRKLRRAHRRPAHHVVVQVLLHRRRVRALRQLSPLLNPTLSENV